MLSLKNKILMTATAIGLASTIGVTHVANAQNNQMQPQGQQQEQMNVTNAQLQEFAEAQVTLQRVQQKFQNEAKNVETEAELETIQNQANQQMVAAIQETELSVQEYTQIAQAIQASPDVQERYKAIVQ